MPVFYSPEGNPEVWEQKPDGYFTPEEWDVALPDPAPSPRRKRNYSSSFAPSVTGVWPPRIIC